MFSGGQELLVDLGKYGEVVADGGLIKERKTDHFEMLVYSQITAFKIPLTAIVKQVILDCESQGVVGQITPRNSQVDLLALVQGVEVVIRQHSGQLCISYSRC